MKAKIAGVVSITGAIIAFMIGSAFGSGQELMQFFSSNGLWGCIGSLVIMAVIYTWICTIIMDDGYQLQLESSSGIWRHYLGKVGGTAIQWFSILFLYSLVIMMISGSGASLSEFAGVPTLTGRVVMSVLVVVTLMLGKDKLTKILAVIGVLLTVLIILVSILSILQNYRGFAAADDVLARSNVLKASPFWWMSGILHPAYSLILLTPFLAGISYGMKDRSVARLGGMFGGISVAVISTALSLALVASMQETAEAEIPTLAIAEKLHPAFGYVYIVILMCGIYSTAVSLEWLVCNSIIGTDEKSLKYRLFALISTAVAFVCSAMPFKRIINVVLPITGYVGILVMVCIVYVRYIKPHVHRNLARPGAVGK